MQKIKDIVYEKMKSTIFGEAWVTLSGIYSRNRITFFIEMILTYLVSIILTGSLAIAWLNLARLGKGGMYKYNIPNIFSAWLSKGLLLSLAMFILVQILVTKYVRMIKTGYTHESEGNYNVSENGTYGTAKLMEREVMEKTFVMDNIKNMKATIFGRDPQHPNILVGQKHPLLKVNRNTFMVAGPSAGKSATFVIPLIMQIMRRGESAIISDPKSELFKYLAELGKKLGYTVRILNLNPMFLANSDPCNFMMYVGDDVDKAQVLANAIINNTTNARESGDFWTEGALNLLQGIILRINVGNDYSQEDKNLPMLFTYLTENDLEGIEADFDTCIRPNHPAYAPFRIFADGDIKVKQQTLQGLRIKLKLFNSEKLRNILSRTEGGIDILDPGRKKCLYFVGSNDQDSSMASIVSLFYTLLYQELVRYADMRKDGQLPKTVHMVLDEYANMGTIPDFEKKLSTVRSRNIVTYIIVQDINQLKEKHPGETWKTVLNDCDYFLMLKTNDPDTMDWWVQMSGEQTAAVINRRYDKSKMDILGLHNKEQVTVGEGTKTVFTKHQVRTLKDDEVLLLVTQRNITKLKTFFWGDHPYGKYLNAHQDDMFILPAEHYPFWRLIEDGLVTPDFDYDHSPSFKIELKYDEQIADDSDYDPDKILKLEWGQEKSKKKAEIFRSNKNAVNPESEKTTDNAQHVRRIHLDEHTGRPISEDMEKYKVHSKPKPVTDKYDNSPYQEPFIPKDTVNIKHDNPKSQKDNTHNSKQAKPVPKKKDKNYIPVPEQIPAFNIDIKEDEFSSERNQEADLINESEKSYQEYDSETQIMDAEDVFGTPDTDESDDLFSDMDIL